MLHTKMWYGIVTKIKSHNNIFVVQISNLMAQEGWLRIIIYVLKIGNSICAIIRIPCACIVCTSILDKPRISGIPPNEQEIYKTVTNFTYWPVLGSFNNWNIIQLSHKSTPSDAFDEVCQGILDGISDHMASFLNQENIEPLTQLIQQLVNFM